MVDTMQSTYQYYCVGDKELDRLLRGRKLMDPRITTFTGRALFPWAR